MGETTYFDTYSSENQRTSRERLAGCKRDARGKRPRKCLGFQDLGWLRPGRGFATSAQTELGEDVLDAGRPTVRALIDSASAISRSVARRDKRSRTSASRGVKPTPVAVAVVSESTFGFAAMVSNALTMLNASAIASSTDSV